MMREEIDKLIEWTGNFVFGPARGVAIGLSGGIDSAVVAALCQEALGVNMEKESNVHLWYLPCGSAPDEIKDAELIAVHLGLELGVIHLDEGLSSLMKGFGIIKDDKVKMIYANMKARLRMAMLYAKAFENDHLVAGTGNKSELAIGYLTKYGDGGVDFEPLGDYYKTEVWEIAKLLGLPQKIIEKKPTAGLWEGQTDEGELGMNYYELDEILKKMNPDLVLSPPDSKTRKVVELVRRSAHKRNMPPMYERGKKYD